MKVLLASDGFVTDDVLRTAMSAAAPEAQLAAIASTWPVPPYGDVGEVREAAGDEDELVAALRGCDVAFSHTFPFTRKVIEACPDLKMIAICRGGPVNVNIEAASDHGVLVSYAPGRNAVATAEHSVGMILAAMRQIPQRNAELLAGQWRSDYYIFDNVGLEVGSSTVGVIGYGAVGRRVAHIMASFGGDVLVHDPWAADRSGEGVAFVDTLEELLRRSDIVTLHARATPDNHHMIDAEALALMPANSVFVNCARGELVDYDAVCDALDSGHLFAAGFDVLPAEPLPLDHRLMSTSRVVLTPHLAGASKEAARLAARIGAADIAAFIRGERPAHLANPNAFERK
ncbi:2-hydroxyacid dehydrogenase [Peptidiphaga sp.]|jgi:phosphoglycerate dehydrogenase|uniref:2-hydroxyacid dehydrogenase n=1 Tax=Peptidiphaga sp. TaxID=2848648 RepID=UPI003613748D